MLFMSAYLEFTGQCMTRCQCLTKDTQIFKIILELAFCNKYRWFHWKSVVHNLRKTNIIKGKLGLNHLPDSKVSSFWGSSFGEQVENYLKNGAIFWKELSEDLDLDTSNFQKVYMILKSEIILVYTLMASFF